MSVHTLKIISPYYEEQASGAKNFELRKEDSRTFQPNDILVLKHWDPKLQQFTDKPILFRMVTYVLRTRYGIAPDWVIISTRPLEPHT
jgi:hypothetical protein